MPCSFLGGLWRGTRNPPDGFRAAGRQKALCENQRMEWSWGLEYPTYFQCLPVITARLLTFEPDLYLEKSQLGA